MNEQRKSTRIRERLQLRIPVRVRCRETPDFEWTEVTRLIDVTPFGAGFSLKRPTERGRLLHMTIPMPRQLRVFDYVEDQYKIWAVVRYVRPLVSAEEKGLQFEVGVAFIGKHPPLSFEDDPTKRYDVTERVTESGMRATSEPAPSQSQSPSAPASERAHTRHNIPVPLSVETFTERGEVAETESTITENISRKGATVYTGLDVPIGRFVRLTSSEYNLTVHAVVRGHSRGLGGMPRMHLEFIDKEWPVD
jgi:hypothetical protein